jgi:thiol-disulfide isomerase/thioredoxin
MNSRITKFFIIGFLIFLLSGCGGSSSSVKPEDIVVGGSVGDFSLPALDGRTLNSSEFKGQPVVLNFWATWCSNCMKEIPELKQIAATGNARVVSIALDEDGSSVIKPFTEKHQINYTVLVGNQDIFQQFNGVAIPYTLVLDGSHRITKIFRGNAGRESIESELKKIAQTSKASL